MTEYEVSRPVGRCAISGNAIAPGEAFHTALFETAAGFERRDYCESAWQGPPEGAVCHFLTRLPRAEEKRKIFIDDDALIQCFQNLADANDDQKLRFRFVLSLILLRKRLLKYERTARESAGEFWEMRLQRDKSLHRVLNPSMNESEIETLSGELGAILAGWAASGEAADSLTADSPQDVPS